MSCELVCHQNLSSSSLRAEWDKKRLSNGIKVFKHLIDGDYRVNMELDDLLVISKSSKGIYEW